MELAQLLPGWQLDLHLVGPDVPDGLHSTQQTWAAGMWGTAGQQAQGQAADADAQSGDAGGVGGWMRRAASLRACHLPSRKAVGGRSG